MNRQYHSYRSLLLPGKRLPKSRSEAVDSIVRQLDLVKTSGYFDPKPGVLNIVSGFEFGFNGAQDPETGDFEFSARHPIPKSWYIDMVIAVQDRLSKLPEGIVYCPGTLALDVETTLNGKQVGENRGFLISSGKESDIVEFTKANQHPIDGWEECFHVGGDGPVLYRAKDVLGGQDAWIAVAVCFDYTQELTSGRVRFPIRPDIILSPSAGWPKRNSPDDVAVIVNDAKFNPFSDTKYFSQTGEWKPVERDPVLSKALARLKDAFPVATPFLTGLQMTLLESPRWAEYVKPYKVMSLQPYSVVDFGLEKAVDTGERALVEEISEERLTQVADAVAHDQGSLVTGGIGETEVARYVQTLTEMTRDLPWDFFKGQINDAISEEVERQLKEGGLDPTSNTDDLFGKLDLDAIRQVVRETTTELVMSSVGGNADFVKELVTPLGQDVATGLVTSAFGDRLVRNMDAASDGTSFLRATIELTLTDRRLHALKQDASRLQAELASASRAVEATSGEVAARAASLSAVEERLESDPTNTDLLEQKRSLEQELGTLRETLRQKEKENADRQRDVTSNEAEQDATERRREDAQRRTSERSADVFRFRA
ncbi:hypothetical protein [Sorangium sp. So ce385]|uniref:hypothetical protein n=1 Tax=Sorangium sp. So ce385 TaxID=3133308 RepID=UPI003F5B3E2D